MKSMLKSCVLFALICVMTPLAAFPCGNLLRRLEQPGTSALKIAISKDGLLYISDGLNDVVAVLDRCLNLLFAIEDFDNPQGVALSSDGLLYVVDSGANQVKVFDLCGNTLFAFDVANNPSNIAIGPDGKVYVTRVDTLDVEVFDRCGTALYTFGSGFFTAMGGITVSKEGLVYVTNRKIEDDMEEVEGFINVFDACGNFLYTFNLPVESLGDPTDIAISPEGLLYVTDSGININEMIFIDDHVRVLDRCGNLLTSFGDGITNFDSPFGIAISPEGLIYVVDNSGVAMSSRLFVFQ